MSPTTLPAPIPRRYEPANIAAVADITYSTGDSRLGTILIARSDVGVCAILLGDDGDDLVDDLASRFPGSFLKADGTALRDELAKVVQFIDSPRTPLDFALDMRGTPFQRRVWNALRAIPAGTTINYTELARRVGDLKAVRAVASACASNPIALAVPCHRVVRSDGDLAGYRWGIERKRALLALEVRK